MKLYKDFHLDDPWDSADNKKLIERMPEIYRGLNDKLAREGKTTFLVPIGDRTFFSNLEGMRFREVTDGLSNTIVAVDAADESAVIWTKPDDLLLDPKQPLRGLVGHIPHGIQILMGDGSVRIISKEIDPKTLRAIFTINGGESASDF